MIRTFIAALSLAFALNALADGQIAVVPTSDPAATWQFESICIHSNAAPPAAVINIVWLTQAGRNAQLDTDLYPRAVTLAGAELVSFIGAVSPASTDAFSGTAGAAKRFRQRAGKWLIDNGKIARGANE